MTPIALQARMLQSGIAYWQAWVVMQKHMFLAMTGQLQKEPDAAEDPAVEAPAVGRRHALGV